MGYYVGDFYAGDPGIGSFFGGLAKKAIGFIPGIGPAASAIVSSIGRGRAATGGVAPKGYHLCKSKHGCKGGQFVRNRHMNPCNPRALRRAIRRTHSFARLAMHTIHLVHPKKKARFGGFKKKRTKKRRRKMPILTKMSEVPTPESLPFFEAGGNTFHKHRCPHGPHDWLCNSPYCEVLTDLCPDHEGHEPVRKGSEPWRR